MARAKDLSGRRFGMLTVGARVDRPDPHAHWACRCDCGNTVEVGSNNLQRGQHSCGCVALGRRTHAMTDSRVYRIWIGMRKRCSNPRDCNYANYGGRGIKVCERWRSFENFLADMGEPPPGHSIERKDNDLGYFPENCCWLPKGCESLNRRGNIYFRLGGERVTAKEASRRLGVKYTTFLYRHNAGTLGLQAVSP